MSGQDKPESIYVWLVPSEEVLEQPGSWRIRKWDTAPFPEATHTVRSSLALTISGSMALAAEIEAELNQPTAGAEGVWYCVADDKPCPTAEGCSAGQCGKYGQPAVEKVRRLARLAHRAAEVLKSAATPAATETMHSRLSRDMDEQRRTYDAVADAVNDVATEAHTAFVKAGLEPGEWDGDNIVEDVKRGIVACIEELANRSTPPWPEGVEEQQKLDGERAIKTHFAPSAIAPKDSAFRCYDSERWPGTGRCPQQCGSCATRYTPPTSGPQESPIAWALFFTDHPLGLDYMVFPDEEKAKAYADADGHTHDQIEPLYRTRAFRSAIAKQIPLAKGDNVNGGWTLDFAFLEEICDAAELKKEGWQVMPEAAEAVILALIERGLCKSGQAVDIRQS